MKRSPLKRKSALKRGAGLRRTGALVSRARLSTHRKSSAPNPLRDEFKTVRDGICRVCGKHGLVRRHHVVTEQTIRREGGDPWDLRWGMWIGVGSEAGMLATCECHRRHHDAAERIPRRLIPLLAVDAAVELLGHEPAVMYFDRYYAPAAGIGGHS